MIPTDPQIPTLIHGDCLEKMQEIPSGSVDMILCDLPYGVTRCAWDSVLPLDSLWAQYKRLLKPEGAIVLTASQPFTSVLVMSNPGWFKHSWVWNKKFAANFMQAKHGPLKIHEDVLVFCKGSPTYNPQMTKRDRPIKLGGNRCQSETSRIDHAKTEYEGKVYTEKFPETIVLFPRERGLHPTQKPVALFQYLIETYTNPGEVVLDSCVGSGTTLVAAMNCSRRSIGIELDPAYFQVASDRIRNAQPVLFAA